MSETKSILGKDAVLQELAEHPAVKAIVAANVALLTDAKFDRGEVTLTVAPEQLIEAARILQAAGYNFFEDMTAVDWFPSEPRFQLSYHILSHGFREHIRLCAWVGGDAPAIDSMTVLWPSANFFEREVFDLFGISFHQHPNLRRIMMPDEWVGYPLRKDYPVEGYR